MPRPAGFVKLLRTMSIKELGKLELALADEFTRRSEIEHTQKEIAEQIKASGFSMSELVSKAGKRKYTKKNKAKWAHKKDPTKTWTGYGRPPKWFRLHGRKVE